MDTSWFLVGSLVAWALLMGLAWWRARRMVVVIGVLFGLHSFSTVALWASLSWAWPVVIWAQAATFGFGASLFWPGMRGWALRLFVNLPAQWWVAGAFLALPWALLAALGFSPPLAWLPFALAALGVVQSLWARWRVVDLVLDGEHADALSRWSVKGGGAWRAERPLRVVQISDPHLGTFMSEDRLRRICQRAVAKAPDLILVTGDFLTYESQQDPALLRRALEPLRAMEGRVFACMGNHDHEAPEIVLAACRAAGVRMLIDREAVVETEAGPVQLLGADFVWKDRRQHLEALCARYPRREGMLRLVMLHDPGAFRHLPEGQADLVLSGHTHGGQVGLVSLGLPWTMVSLITSIPDHGFWARGADRLYVHRGCGHYGFPLRLGVPAEEGMLRIHAPVLEG